MLLATLVTLAEGLARAGFVKWFADYVATHVGGMPPMLILMSLVAIYFLSHYMFASLTAHTTAMMPMMLAAGLAIPGLAPMKLAMGLAMTTGLMAVLTPYATGAALPYYNSRLPDAGAVLAAGGDLRADLPGGAAGGRGAAAGAVGGVPGRRIGGSVVGWVVYSSLGLTDGSGGGGGTFARSFGLVGGACRSGFTWARLSVLPEDLQDVLVWLVG